MWFDLTMRVLLPLLAVSLVLHLMFLWSLTLVPKYYIEPSKENIEFEIKHKDIPDTVTHVDVPDNQKIKELKDEVRFLSETAERVLLETKARETGLTKNRQNFRPVLKPEPKPIAPKTPGEGSTPSATIDHQQDYGFSTISEALPNDLAEGSMTALNTNQSQYYSFNQRLKERTATAWYANLEKVITPALGDYLNKNSLNHNFITYVELWINKDGIFHSTHLLKRSGYNRFDDAAEKAFHDVQVFPRPPKEWIQDDGLIRIPYSFQVRLRER